jgi:hypothetical protein
MAKNYLPFARRVYLDVPAGTRRSILREQFSSGMGNRAFLSDVAIDLIYIDGITAYNYNWQVGRVLTERVFMRMGIFGAPYLTEDFYPIALFNDSPMEEAGVWRLPKPYTIFPGERLKARVQFSPGGAVAPLPAEAYGGYYATWPSIAFHGVRQDNKRPIVLYDTFPSTFDQNDVFVTPPLGTPVILQGERLQCPKETPVDIYAVKNPTCGDGQQGQFPGVQIWSPDGRKWWEDDRWPLVLYPTFVIKNLRGPEWVLDVSETLQIEFENLPVYSFDRTLMVTLRGQVEVEI